MKISRCLILFPLMLVSCVSNTRWSYILPDSTAVYKKCTQDGATVFDPANYHQPAERMKWHGSVNAAKEANGLGVLTLCSADGSEVTDSEMGEMKNGYFQGTVYSNHKTGGRAIWKYMNGSKMEIVIAWDNRFFERPTSAGFEERFPPIGDPNRDWRAYARAEQTRRENEKARAKALAAKQKSSGGLSFSEQFMLNVLTSFGEALKQTSSPTHSGSASEGSGEGTSFTHKYAGKYADFTVTYDGMDPRHFILGQGESNYLVLRSSSGDRFSVRYSGELQTGSVSKKPSLEGTTINVRFDSSGEPRSLRNQSNGYTAPVRSWGLE